MSETNLPRLPSRKSESHKGDYGRVLLVGGSANMSGAIALSGIAALRSGAGLVTVATANVCQSVVAGHHPALMTMGLDDDENGLIRVPDLKQLERELPKADCLAFGPGIGQSSALQQLTRDVFQHCELPVVLDADGLNNLGQSVTGVPAGPRVLTPHPGELQRMIPDCGPDRQAWEQSARSFAEKHNCVVVLKGHRTWIVGLSNSEHNATGNPGMATAGSGDVLTGMIAALLAQGLSDFDAAVLGCHVHGLAGDLAAKRFGMTSLIATDLIEFLPQAWQSVS